MTIPASYTEATLKAFMLSILEQSGVSLELITTDFDEAVTTTIMSYGVTDIALATDILKLRAMAKVNAWRVALAQASKDTFEAVLANLRAAEREVTEYASVYASYPQYAVTVGKIHHTEDPYSVERMLP